MERSCAAQRRKYSKFLIAIVSGRRPQIELLSTGTNSQAVTVRSSSFPTCAARLKFGDLTNFARLRQEQERKGTVFLLSRFGQCEKKTHTHLTPDSHMVGKFVTVRET